jgi:hypothetical protein
MLSLCMEKVLLGARLYGQRASAPTVNEGAGLR